MNGIQIVFGSVLGRSAFIAAQYGTALHSCIDPAEGTAITALVDGSIVGTANVHDPRNLPCRALGVLDIPPRSIEVTRLTCSSPDALPHIMRAILGVGIAMGAISVVSLARSAAHARLYRRFGLRTIGPVLVNDIHWHTTGHTYTAVQGDLFEVCNLVTGATLGRAFGATLPAAGVAP